jgi:hypothetical protein
MKTALRATLVALLVFPVVATAQISLGLRAGYGFPGGDLQKDSKLKDQLKSQIPLQLDAMYRVTPRAAVGAYVGYAFGQVADKLKDNTAFFVGSGADYTASTFRAGLQATYSFTGMTLVPWVGLGSGLEVGNFEVKNGAAKVTGTTRGWEIVNFQAGADYPVSPSFAAGLFASFAIGRFTYQGGEVSGTGVLDGTSGGGLGSDTTEHTWFTIGLRGKFDL